MKVAIDSGPLSGGDAIRGIGFHTKELVNELKKLQGSDFKFEVVDFSKTDLSKYDLVHYQSFNPYRTKLPILKPSKRMVLTIHDLIYLIYPNAYPSGIKGKLNFYLQKFNLRNVDAIITISETSKKDIVRLLGIDPDKIFVTYLAPQSLNKDSKKQLSKQELPDNFVLYIGDVNYNKNLLSLAKACKLAKLKLVIVGKQAVATEISDNVENKPWKQFIKLYGEDKDIIRLGFVENLEDIFRRASIYCQPSLYEGFGLPLLEAFEKEVPVVASRSQALVEVGGDACLYVDPMSPEDIAKGLRKVIVDKKFANNLVKKGRERLKYFSWKKTAEGTLEVYKHVAK